MSWSCLQLNCMICPSWIMIVSVFVCLLKCFHSCPQATPESCGFGTWQCGPSKQNRFLSHLAVEYQTKAPLIGKESKVRSGGAAMDLHWCTGGRWWHCQGCTTMQKIFDTGDSHLVKTSVLSDINALVNVFINDHILVYVEHPAKFHLLIFKQSGNKRSCSFSLKWSQTFVLVGYGLVSSIQLTATQSSGQTQYETLTKPSTSEAFLPQWYFIIKSLEQSVHAHKNSQTVHAWCEMCYVPFNWSNTSSWGVYLAGAEYFSRGVCKWRARTLLHFVLSPRLAQLHAPLWSSSILNQVMLGVEDIP